MGQAMLAQVVPEPASAALMALGPLAVLGALQRRPQPVRLVLAA